MFFDYKSDDEDSSDDNVSNKTKTPTLNVDKQSNTIKTTTTSLTNKRKSTSSSSSLFRDDQDETKEREKKRQEVIKSQSNSVANSGGSSFLSALPAPIEIKNSTSPSNSDTKDNKLNKIKIDSNQEIDNIDSVNKKVLNEKESKFVNNSMIPSALRKNLLHKKKIESKSNPNTNNNNKTDNSKQQISDTNQNNNKSINKGKEEDDEDDDIPLFSFSDSTTTIKTNSNEIDEDLQREIQEQKRQFQEQEETADHNDYEQEEQDQYYQHDEAEYQQNEQYEENEDENSLNEYYQNGWTEEQLQAYYQQQYPQQYQQQQVDYGLQNRQFAAYQIQNTSGGFVQVNQSNLLSHDQSRIKELREKEAALGPRMRASSGTHRSKHQWTSLLTDFHAKKQQLEEKKIEQQFRQRHGH